MAAYAASVTLDFPRTVQIGNTSIGLISGVVDLTNYNSTLAEITAITGKFLSTGFFRVVADGVSSEGYVLKWDEAEGAFRAYTVGASEVTPTGDITASAPTITTGTNAGTTTPVYTNGGALTQVAGASGITGVQAPVITDARTFEAAGGLLVEAANDTDVGTCNFIVLGQM